MTTASPGSQSLTTNRWLRRVHRGGAFRSKYYLCRHWRGLQRPDLSVGDGIYKSTDAGRSWTHLGLRDGQQIPQIAVDPRDPNRLLVAVAGHPYGPNEERGIFRSTDGGKTFAKVSIKMKTSAARMC